MAIQDTQDWLAAYIELCTLINDNIPEIKHIDLWYDQLNYELEEYPYPEKSLFIEFNSQSGGVNTLGTGAQEIDFNIRFIFAFDTFSDTFDGSENQAAALAFGTIMRKLHALLQMTSGTNFSSLDRNAITKEVAPQHCICYSQTYACVVIDYGAVKDSTEVDLSTIPVTLEVDEGTITPDVDNTPLYEINL